MHPAVSVIFFTVTSGAGLGLLALVGAGMPMPEGVLAAFLISALAIGLSAVGLLASTFHLGHPERAWRAFSQWRSSWLSREGVLSVATLAVFGLYALIWIFAGERIAVLGWLSAIGAVATVIATAMIYAQLKTVPQWNSGLTPACYLAFALASGFLPAAALAAYAGFDTLTSGAIAAFLIAAAWVVKAVWWSTALRRSLADRGSTPESATGLGFIGRVRLFERPHTGENYLTREMVHVIGRRHAFKLRWIALVLGAAVPFLIAAVVALMPVAPAWLGLAFLSMVAGLFVERWLFFAEATHAVSLYYGSRGA